jgi:hypothetical protein
MNAIEQARRRYEVNKAARERQEAKKALVALEIPKEVPVEVPMAKPTTDAVISVTVVLPNAEHRFTLTKKNVLQNVPNEKLKANEFRKCVVDGLRPILGDVS